VGLKSGGERLSQHQAMVEMMTESNGQPSKSSRMAALMNTSYGRSNDQLAARLRWMLVALCSMTLFVILLAWWRQGAV